MANSENLECRGSNCPLAQVNQIEDENQALFAACKKTSRIPGGELAVYPEPKKSTQASNAYRIECLMRECQVEPKRQIFLQVPRLIRIQLFSQSSSSRRRETSSSKDSDLRKGSKLS